MNYAELIARIVSDGIAAARADYTRPDQEYKLKGSIEGFERCRGVAPSDLPRLDLHAASALSRLRSAAPMTVRNIGHSMRHLVLALLLCGGFFHDGPLDLRPYVDEPSIVVVPGSPTTVYDYYTSPVPQPPPTSELFRTTPILRCQTVNMGLTTFTTCY